MLINWYHFVMTEPKAFICCERAQKLFKALHQLGGRSRGHYQDKINEIDELKQLAEYHLYGYKPTDDDKLPAYCQNTTLDSDQKALVTNCKSDAPAQSTENVDTLEWKGRDIPLRSRELSGFVNKMSKLQESIKEEKNERRRLGLYTKLFIVLDEAIIYIREDTAQLQSSQVRTQVTAMKQEHLEALQEKFTFEKLKLVIDRYGLTHTTMTRHLFTGQGRRRDRGKPANLASICEKLVASIQELGSVLDVHRNKRLGNEIKSSTGCYQALRTFHIANSYFELEKFDEAYALFNRAQALLVEAVTLSSQTSFTTLDNPTQTAQEFGKLAVRNKFLSRAKGILAREKEEADAADGIKHVSLSEKTNKVRYLLDRLDEFKKGNEENFYDLIEFPLKQLKPIPQKPIFFDIAQNYVSYDEVPELKDFVSQEKKQGGGWFGWG